MFQKIKSSHPDVILNGSNKLRLPHNLNLCFPGLEAESMIMKMKKKEKTGKRIILKRNILSIISLKTC